MQDRHAPEADPTPQPGPEAAREAAPKPQPPGADETVSDIISEFSEVFAFARSRWARFAEEVHPDLRGVGLIMLQLISRKGSLTATGIAKLLDMDKAVVSRQIAKLRELELIETEPAPEDRRVVLLTSSPRARMLLEGIRGKWSRAYEERFAGWSETELTELRSSLRRFNASAAEALPDTPSGRCTREHTTEAAASDPSDTTP